MLPPAQTSLPSALKIPFLTRLPRSSSLRSDAKVARWVQVCSLLAWLLLVTAAAGPQWVGEPIALPQSGRDIMMAVDISGSMQTPDMLHEQNQVDRLQITKIVAGEFIQHRVGDRIGLILFGTQAYLLTPLTFDRTTVLHMLNDSSVGLAGSQTALGDAIGLAIKRLVQHDQQQRVLIVLTDGVANAGAVTPLQAARLAKKNHIRIHTIGIGSDQMLVDSLSGPQVLNPSQDLDESTLRKISEITGGLYFRAKDKKALEEIYRTIDELEPVTHESQWFRPVREYYPWPLILALLLIGLLGVWHFEPCLNSAF